MTCSLSQLADGYRRPGANCTDETGVGWRGIAAGKPQKNSFNCRLR